jgi:hypothetical protein
MTVGVALPNVSVCGGVQARGSFRCVGATQDT